MPVDPEVALLASVIRRSLTTAETDARRLRRKNANTLRLAIELSKREATKEAVAKAKAARHAKEQDQIGSTFNSDDEHEVQLQIRSEKRLHLQLGRRAPPHTDAYTKEWHNRANNQKGKGPAR